MFSKYKFIFSMLTLIFVSCSKKNGDSEIKPKVSDIVESVYASGIVKAEGQYTVYSTVNGILQKVNVNAGQSIEQELVLFELKSEKAALNTENALLAFQLSQQNNRFILDKIAEMEMRVQSAKDKLALDESVYQRNKNIREMKVISEVEFERVELAYNNSKLNYESTKKQLSQLKAQLNNEQNRSSVNLKLSEESQDEYKIKSAFSGELFDVLVKKGVFITPQTPMAVIGKADAFILELEVDENDMVKIERNQKVLVTMDSYKGKVFDAVVTKIYPIMDMRSRTFKIEAQFVHPPKKLYPNLTAEANIIIRTKKNVITIPKTFLIQNEYVLVNKDEKRKVVIGLGDYQKVEVVSGLNSEETIYKPK
jgi:HlyD family secretion protein